MPSSISLLKSTLHERSDSESMARVRAQFLGSDQEFAELAEQYFALAPRLRGNFLRWHDLDTDDAQALQGTPLSLAVSPEMGRFLHNMVLAHRPARVLELGSSYGVSTLYIAEALRVLGAGTVVATEMDPVKCAYLREHMRVAGVAGHVDLREGDLFDTVRCLDGSFDIVFIDVWADAYLRVFKQIERLLRPGTLVLSDNMYTAQEAVRGYKTYLTQHPRLSSTTLDFESGVEFTVVVS